MTEPRDKARFYLKGQSVQLINCSDLEPEDAPWVAAPDRGWRLIGNMVHASLRGASLHDATLETNPNQLIQFIDSVLEQRDWRYTAPLGVSRYWAADLQEAIDRGRWFVLDPMRFASMVTWIDDRAWPDGGYWMVNPAGWVERSASSLHWRLSDAYRARRLVASDRLSRLRHVAPEPVPPAIKQPFGAGSSRATAPLDPAKSVTGAAAVAKPVDTVKTGLGSDVDQLAAKSPSLQSDLRKLDEEDWEINFGPSGGGSFADRRRKIITIDGDLKDHPVSATQTLAHEVGHATYPLREDCSSKAAYVNSTLDDEGAATINNIKARREILANGGQDIGISGNSANHASYNKAYDQFLLDGDADAARRAIGEQFGEGELTSNTRQPYAEYYGNWYDANCPSAK
ncbi:hypothetical protein [Burkholderia ubonensis]|uniref:hypothetical protein n=1 Tax=Burkholderia ubonensis TaxID=101571 RepID=UPI0014531D53|nr:peptidoglycan-binding LysM [Burkholderia ubonensis]